MPIKRACRICGCTEFDLFAVKDGFHLERCCVCSLMQITDDLSDVCLEDYYEKEFFDNTYGGLHQEKGQRTAYEKFAYRLQEIEKLKSEKGTILDVGCSFGYFLDAARSRGWKPVGVEIGEYAARFAQETLKLEVHVSDVRQGDLPSNCFDVICLWDVLEHLDEPLAVLNHLHHLMKKEGLLVFNTPDVDSYIRKLQGLRWRCFIPPIHVTYYGPRAVKALLERTGFRLLSRTVALPREALLQKLHVFNFLKKIHFSDKMLIFAEKA